MNALARSLGLPFLPMSRDAGGLVRGPVLALTRRGTVLDGAAAAALEQGAAVGFGFGLAQSAPGSAHYRLVAVLAQHLASA